MAIYEDEYLQKNFTEVKKAYQAAFTEASRKLAEVGNETDLEQLQKFEEALGQTTQFQEKINEAVAEFNSISGIHRHEKTAGQYDIGLRTHSRITFMFMMLALENLDNNKHDYSSLKLRIHQELLNNLNLSKQPEGAAKLAEEWEKPEDLENFLKQFIPHLEPNKPEL